MPRGHSPGRETRKPKKKNVREPLTSAPLVTPSEVEVIKKKRKVREE